MQISVVKRREIIVQKGLANSLSVLHLECIECTQEEQ